ncbi:MAG: 30S ribosomal protein S1 [Aggregatilineales bacterium]
MESNIPVVGGSDPEPGTPHTATPTTEANGTASANVEQPVSTPPVNPPAMSAPEPESQPPATGSVDESAASPVVPADAPAINSDELAVPDEQPAASHDEATPSEDHAEVPESRDEATLSDDESSVYDAEQAPADIDTESMAALLEQSEGTSGLKKGDIVEGTIISTSPTEIRIDVGLKIEGVVQSKELERMDKATMEQLKPGDKILVYVVNGEDRNGNVVLSITRALEEQDWHNAETLRQNKGIYNGKVDGFNKGGLIVRFGRVRGFVPESQVSRERRQRAEAAANQDKWAGMRGEDIGVKVLEVDRVRNRLILSEREAAPQRREQMKAQLLDELKVGDVRIGHVKSLAEFGAFVDVGGADGLVHLTEISWKHVTHPQEALKVGQEVKVEVISIDRERKRIGLSIKRQEEDPWMAIASQYAIGDLVQGTITKLVKFGAFARLVDNPEIEGLIHITELSDRRVTHPRDVLHEGDVLTLRVVKIEGDRRRLGLSLKRVNSTEYLDRDYARATGAPRPAVPDFPPDPTDPAFQDDERRRERRKVRKGSGKRGGRGGEFEEEGGDF